MWKVLFKIFLFLLALFVASRLTLGLLVRNEMLFVYTASSSLMYPTIQLGENIFVIPLKSESLFTEKRRQEIVAYGDKDNALFSRIIGFPGEEITVNSGSIYINNVKLEENYFEGMRGLLNEAPIRLSSDEVYLLYDDESAGRYSPGVVRANSVWGKVVW